MMDGERQKGFTLIELLVAMAITSMLMAIVALAFTGQSRSYNSQQDMVSLQQEVRSALQLIAEEIRMAGYDPTGKADAAITIATATNLRFTQDIDDGAGGPSDGKTDDPNEDIRYAINTNGALGRETGGLGGLQPVADNIVQLAYEYNLDNDTWTQTPADLKQIRAIKVMLLGRSARETAGTVDSSTFKLPLDPSNPTAPPTWTPANPGNYHWRLMSVVVQCRNIQIKKG